MTRFGRLALILLTFSILSYGFSGFSFAQETPADCGPDQVFQLGQCVDIGERTQSAPFTVETDQPSYDDGDTINISGMILTLNENFAQDVTLILFDPNGNIVFIAQIIPDSSGAYSTSLMASSEGTMKKTGDYEIRVQYGAQESTTSFSFTASGFIVSMDFVCNCGWGYYVHSHIKSNY